MENAASSHAHPASWGFAVSPGLAHHTPSRLPPRRRKQRSRRSPKSAPTPNESAAGEVFSPPSPPQLDEQTEGAKKSAEGLGACDRPETTAEQDEQDGQRDQSEAADAPDQNRKMEPEAEKVEEDEEEARRRRDRIHEEAKKLFFQEDVDTAKVLGRPHTYVVEQGDGIEMIGGGGATVGEGEGVVDASTALAMVEQVSAEVDEVLSRWGSDDANNALPSSGPASWQSKAVPSVRMWSKIEAEKGKERKAREAEAAEQSKNSRRRSTKGSGDGEPERKKAPTSRWREMDVIELALGRPRARPRSVAVLAV